MTNNLPGFPNGTQSHPYTPPALLPNSTSPFDGSDTPDRFLLENPNLESPVNRYGEPKGKTVKHDKPREERLAEQKVEKKAAQAERVAAKEAAKKAAEEAANQPSWLERAANAVSGVRNAVQGAINQARSYFVEAPVEAPKTEIELATPQPVAVQAADKKERERKDVLLLFAQVNGNIISVNAQMPENVNLTAIAENSGLTDPNFAVNFQVNATANGIVGESTLIIPSGVAQVVLSVNGLPLSGAAYQSAASNNTFSLLSPAINIVLNADSVTLFGSGALNGGSIAIEGLSPDPATPNSVANVLGIFPATPSFVTNAPYVHSAAAQPDAVGYDGNMQLYKASSGNFYTVAKVTGADDLPQLVQQFYTASGVHLAAQDNVLFSIANTGPVGSTDTAIPTNNTESISAGTFDITNFSTRPLSDGTIEIAVVYDIGTAETAGVVMAVDKDGKILAGVRDINAGIPNGPIFNKVRRTIAVNGVVPGSNDVFAAFSKGGVLQDGHLVNATDLSISSSSLADHSSLEPSANNQIVDGFNIISANKNIITAATFSNPNGIRTGIENIRTHAVANNEIYDADSFSGDRAIAGHPTIIIVPPSVQGAQIVFAANKSYTMVNQGGNAQLFFPQAISAQSVTTEMVNVDGVASVRAIFPGNTNITFYGEDQGFVANLISQLQVLTTTVPETVARTLATQSDPTSDASTSVTQPDTSNPSTSQPVSQSSSISNPVSEATTTSLAPTTDPSTSQPVSQSSSISNPVSEATIPSLAPITDPSTSQPASQSSSISNPVSEATIPSLAPITDSSTSQSNQVPTTTTTITYSVVNYTSSASTGAPTTLTASITSNTPTQSNNGSNLSTTEGPASSTTEVPPNEGGGDNAKAPVLGLAIGIPLGGAVLLGVIAKYVKNRRGMAARIAPAGQQYILIGMNSLSTAPDVDGAPNTRPAPEAAASSLNQVNIDSSQRQ